jgi:hypothetical protein
MNRAAQDLLDQAREAANNYDIVRADQLLREARQHLDADDIAELVAEAAISGDADLVRGLLAPAPEIDQAAPEEAPAPESTGPPTLGLNIAGSQPSFRMPRTLNQYRDLTPAQKRQASAWIDANQR